MSEDKQCAQCGAALVADAPQGLCPACLLKRGFATSIGGGQSNSQGTRTEYVPPTPTELARYFPELEILEVVGRGGMGVVYRARQKRLDRLVALKILPPNISRDPAFSERFTREAKALARLTHPNIVSIHDFGQTDGLFYFVMEFVDGLNLRQLLDTAKITPKEALAIVPQICDALQFAHDKGIVHRDIKPENILIDKGGVVKIADFGLAKLVGLEAKDLTITSARDVIGTPHYMAPEQIEHPQDVDHRADIYSLGVVFYQMLTGELPIGRFAPPSRKVQIDVRLDEVVLRALEKEPEHRYQQASEVKTQMQTIAETPSTAPHAAVPRDTPTPPPIGQRYAGFWRRFLAVLIDYILVSACIFPLVILIGLYAPDYVVVSTPSDLFTTERVLETKQTEKKNVDGSITAIETNLIEVTCLGKWTYLYREVKQHSAGNTQSSRQLLDPNTKTDRHVATVPDIVFWVLFVYWILMEGSRYQASLGKLALGLKVVDNQGNRLSMIHALGRNALKFLSALPLLIGFMMAGWTRKKQALHDKITDCFVISRVWRAVNQPVVAPASAVRKHDRFWRWFTVTVVALIASPIIIRVLILPSISLFELYERAQAVNATTNFYIGQTWFPEGDFIEITSVVRTKDRLMAKGHYNLVSHDSALLGLFITSPTNGEAASIEARQKLNIAKGAGDFELVHAHPVPGLPHVSMYADGHSFAALYFGTKEKALEESQASWITHAPPTSERELAARLKAAVEAADTNAMIALFNWQGVPDYPKSPGMKLFARLLEHKKDGMDVHVWSRPVPDDYETESMMNGIRYRPNVTLLGLIRADVSGYLGGTNTGYGIDLLYGKKDDAYYLASYSEEKLYESTANEKTFGVWVEGVISSDPVIFTGLCTYVQNKMEIRKAIRGKGFIHEMFSGDELKSCTIQKISDDKGSIRLVLYENGKKFFESPQVQTKDPIVYERPDASSKSDSR